MKRFYSVARPVQFLHEAVRKEHRYLGSDATKGLTGEQ